MLPRNRKERIRDDEENLFSVNELGIEAPKDETSKPQVRNEITETNVGSHIYVDINWVS